MAKKKIINSYLNLPIRFKILFWFIPLLLITVSITGWYSFYTAKNQVLEKINLAQLELTDQISNQLDYISNDAVDFTNYLFLLSSVQQFLNPKSEDHSLSRRQQINEIASSMLVNQRDIQSLVLYGFNQEVPPLAINQTGITSTMPFEEFKKTKHYQLAVEKAGKPSWTLLKGDEKLFEGDKRTKIILTRVIKNSYTLEDLGIIIIGFNEETLRNKYTNGLSNDAQMFILDDNNQVITSTDQQWIGKKVIEVPFFVQNKSGSIKLSNKDFLLSRSHAQLGWETILIQPRDELLKELDTIKVWTLLVTAICFIMGLWFSWHVSFFITKPLKKLTKSMEKLQEGDFSQKVEFKGNDEVGALGKGYDIMVQRTRKLINDVYRSQLRQKEAELKSLQAQINPHFLYNTLDTIFWKAKQKQQDEIANMIYSLSQFFRLSLSDGKDFVPVEHEVLLIENYLNIQKNRFSNRFTYEIGVDENCKNIVIPKLLIQPLVENSILHGMDSIEENGFIYVHIFRKNSLLNIHIVDNGKGMKSDQLKLLNEYLQSTHFDTKIIQKDNRPGYALMNINERLRMSYSTSASMEIESKEQVGTKIIITIPIHDKNFQH